MGHHHHHHHHHHSSGHIDDDDKHMLEMNIRPLQDRVLVRRAEEEKKSAGGIILTGSAQEKPSQGEVVAVGNGKKLDNGTTLPMDVKVGDKVLFGKYSGSEVKVGDETLLMMREEDIMGIIAYPYDVPDYA
nr:hypothetical protein FTT1695 [synthetic construct]